MGTTRRYSFYIGSRNENRNTQNEIRMKGGQKLRNLDAKQARRKKNNQQMAEELGYKDRKSYEIKKATGTFSLSDAKKLAQFFGVSMDYLFDTKADREANGNG